MLSLGLLEGEWLAGRVAAQAGVVPVAAGDVDVELGLVAVGVVHIQRVDKPAVGGADDGDQARAGVDTGQQRAQVVVAVAGLDADWYMPSRRPEGMGWTPRPASISRRSWWVFPARNPAARNSLGWVMTGQPRMSR